MRYLKRIRGGAESYRISGMGESDPLTGVANLFDIGVVFIVGLLTTFFTSYHLDDLLKKDSEFILMKKDKKNGQFEMITKKNNRIEARRLTKENREGQGQRLGVAYQLEDGAMVYVPDEE